MPVERHNRFIQLQETYCWIVKVSCSFEEEKDEKPCFRLCFFFIFIFNGLCKRFVLTKSSFMKGLLSKSKDLSSRTTEGKYVHCSPVEVATNKASRQSQLNEKNK